MKTEKMRRGQALIGLLIVVAIGMVLYLFLLGPRMGGDGKAQKSVAKQSLDRGEDTRTDSNLNQIRTVINMIKTDSDGKPPASLTELKRASKFPDEMFIDKTTGKPLFYDPATGWIGRETDPRPGVVLNVPPSAPQTAPGAPAMPKIPDIPQPAAPADDGY